jgi:nitroreductase
LVIMRKPATADHPIHDLIRERWSPRAFDDRPVPRADLLSLFEAARWAPSSGNEQPWRFVIAERHADPESFDRLIASLVESNQVWARLAPIVGYSVASLTWARTGKPNRHAWHDVGLSMSLLLVEATSRGLFVHQMAGYDAQKAREACGIPDGFEPVAAFVIGYPGPLDRLDERNRGRETAPRARRPVSESAFQGRWAASLAPESR